MALMPSFYRQAMERHGALIDAQGFGKSLTVNIA